MDGEKNGKPNLLMDDGGFPQQLWGFPTKNWPALGVWNGGIPLFSETPKYDPRCTLYFAGGAVLKALGR